MRRATLTRNESGDEGTFGTLVTDNGKRFRTGELPWRDNASGKSCIPAGTYFCHWRKSQRHGMCYHVDGVPGRSDIEIHVGNFCGDTTRGLWSDVEGCILIGSKVEQLNGQKAVTSSNSSLQALEAELAREDLELTIVAQ